MATAEITVQDVLNKADPNQLPDAIRKAELGNLLTPLKRTFTGLTAAASFDLTELDGDGEDAGPANPKRLPALAITHLRVTAEDSGTAAIGSYAVADAGATPLDPTNSSVVGLATLSDDGKTITFPEADVEGFVIQYIPRSRNDLTARFA